MKYQRTVRRDYEENQRYISDYVHIIQWEYLRQLIRYSNFYWYKDEDPDHYVEPPMDYLWKLCDLGSCPEYEMTFWVCKFIITSSFQMVEDGFPIDEKWQNVFIKDELIRTQEDMYYYALLQLYWLYMIERTTEETV